MFDELCLSRRSILGTTWSLNLETSSPNKHQYSKSNMSILDFRWWLNFDLQMSMIMGIDFSWNQKNDVAMLCVGCCSNHCFHFIKNWVLFMNFGYNSMISLRHCLLLYISLLLVILLLLWYQIIAWKYKSSTHCKFWWLIIILFAKIRTRCTLSLLSLEVITIWLSWLYFFNFSVNFFLQFWWLILNN